VYDPKLDMEAAKSEEKGGTKPFMAPELILPSMFGVDRCIPTKEADIYAVSMTIYQVLTGTLPFGSLTSSEVVFKVLKNEKPSKPANALALGLTGKVWRLLEDCWQTDRTLRPSVKTVLDRVREAASICGVLPSLGSAVKRYEEPESELTKFDQLFLGNSFPDDEDFYVSREQTPEPHPSSFLVSPPPVKDRPPSQDSTLTDTSTSDSLWSKLSEAASCEPGKTSESVSG